MTARIEPHAAEIAFWVTLCVILGTLLGEQTDWGRQIQPPLPDIRYSATTFEAPKLDEPPKFNAPDQYLEMVERPLFVVTRRPAPPPPPPAAQAPTMRKGQFRLAGISIIGDKKVAFLDRFRENGADSQFVERLPFAYGAGLAGSRFQEKSDFLVRKRSP